MDIIETMSHGDFEKYLRKTRNTICGRHPISVLLAAINEIMPTIREKGDKIQLKFVKYAQSNHAKDFTDSS
ncbi:Protein memo1, partial [Spiromyces aspiralis]